MDLGQRIWRWREHIAVPKQSLSWFVILLLMSVAIVSLSDDPPVERSSPDEALVQSPNRDMLPLSPAVLAASQYTNPSFSIVSSIKTPHKDRENL